MKKLFVVGFLLMLLGAGLKMAVTLYLQQPLMLNEPQIIEISKGASLTSVAAKLSNSGLIQYPRLFVKIGQFYGYSSKIKYGEYQLVPKDTNESLFAKLVSGDNFKYEITHVEGDHMYELNKKLELMGLVKKGEFLQLVKNKEFAKKLIGEEIPSLEGYLFPDTYHFAKNDGVRVIINAFVDRFKKEIKEVDPNRVKMTRHQLVTLASIIEKETGAGFERPLISSVFHNRIKKGMKLQTDPTILYGILDKTGTETNNIRKSDILKPTPYNTYVIKGLPPGPIGSPGAEALKAAANPESSKYLYFVSQNDGTHVFTESYKDHLRAVKKFQMNPKMRQGKSWRDLNKKVQ